jgi:Chlorophyllase
VAGEFRIRGVVRESDTGRPLPGLRIRPFDRARLFGELLPETTSDDAGAFEMSIGGREAAQISKQRPDLYFEVYDDQGRLVVVTAEPVRLSARKEQSVTIEVPSHRRPPEEPGLRVLDGSGRHRKELEAGESVAIAADGLRPSKPHTVRVLIEDDEVFSVSLLSDRYGLIAPTVVWPDLGIGDPEEGGRYAFPTLEEAAQALDGRALTIELSAGRRVVHRGSVRLLAELRRPRVFSATREGAPRRGLLAGEDELWVRAMNLPAASIVDLYLVPRQSDWREGDPMTPIVDATGREVVATVEIGEGDREFLHRLWERDRLVPGGYDLIARLTADREWRREDRRFRRTDLVADRLATSVVVRQDVFLYKPIFQGCVNSVQVAGRRLNGSPYFQFTDNFPVGTDVWATLDPAGLMPQKIGKKIRYYVTQHKNATEWTNDPTATDVNGSVIETITASSCVNAAEMLVWSNPQTPGRYDLVVDFGNEAPDPANFVSDGQFNPPVDMIDGAVVVGFYVTDDPAVAGSFPVGHTSYNDPAVTIPAIGVWGPNGPDYGATQSGTLNLPLIADVSYPATVPGVDVPVSNAQASYPLVVVMHGMHSAADPSYQGYTYLLDHLASRGYIAVSIDVNAINGASVKFVGGGMQDTRGHAVLEHLALLRGKNQNPGLFQGKIDMSRIGIMGHSRGGDGVVQAEIYNQQLPPADRFAIKAVVALAPTDFSGTSPSPLNLSTSKFLCVYGANDGDVWGGSNPSTQYAGTGFRFYDRASVEKAVVFVYGATHNRFNTIWGTEGKVDAGSPKVLSAPQHQLVLKGYMTAFLQATIEGRAEQLDYFGGELKLPQAAGIQAHTSYRPDPAVAPAPLTLDNFETNPATNLSSLGGTVTAANLDGAPQENLLGSLDPNSPHQTRGVKLKWNATSGTYRSEIPLVGNQRNLSQHEFLSFRVSQTVASAANPLDQLQDLYVRLATAGGGPSRAVRAGFFQTIPFPYKPEYIAGFDASEAPNTKAALKTVRIPLHAWTVKALSAPIVDLSNVESIEFDFMATGTGEIEIDDIEITA